MQNEVELRSFMQPVRLLLSVHHSVLVALLIVISIVDDSR